MNWAGGERYLSSALIAVVNTARFGDVTVELVQMHEKGVDLGINTLTEHEVV